MFSKHFQILLLCQAHLVIFIYVFIVDPDFLAINLLELGLCPIIVYIHQAWHETGKYYSLTIYLAFTMRQCYNSFMYVN